MEHNTISCSYPTTSTFKQLGCCCDSVLGHWSATVIHFVHFCSGNIIESYGLTVHIHIGAIELSNEEVMFRCKCVGWGVGGVSGKAAL